MRAHQASQILSLVQERGLPCIIGMDMNAAPERSAIADYPSEAYPAVLAHGLGLRSAYAQVLGSEPDYTTWKRRGDKEAKHTIDYIFISGAFSAARALAPLCLQSASLGGGTRRTTWS